MNKARLEALSDGVFAIAMTLLVIEVHVPDIVDGEYSVLGLWNGLLHLFPSIASYIISFTVLAMYWTSHHALFHFFAKTVNRPLVQLNMLYLMLLAFLPFSTALLGTYHTNVLALWFYGIHIILLGVIAYGMFIYALSSAEIDRHEVSHRGIIQAKIRLLLTPSFALIAIIVGVFWPSIAFALFIVPVIFNLIPGSLDKAERYLGITIR